MPELTQMHTRYGRGREWKGCAWCLQAAAHTIQEHDESLAQRNAKAQARLPKGV